MKVRTPERACDFPAGLVETQQPGWTTIVSDSVGRGYGPRMRTSNKRLAKLLCGPGWSLLSRNLTDTL